MLIFPAGRIFTSHFWIFFLCHQILAGELDNSSVLCKEKEAFRYDHAWVFQRSSLLYVPGILFCFLIFYFAGIKIHHLWARSNLYLGSFGQALFQFDTLVFYEEITFKQSHFQSLLKCMKGRETTIPVTSFITRVEPAKMSGWQHLLLSTHHLIHSPHAAGLLCLPSLATSSLWQLQLYKVVKHLKNFTSW